MRIQPSSYLLVVIITISLVFGVISFTYPDIKTKFLPATMSILIFILAVIQLIRELLAAQQVKKETESKAEEVTMLKDEELKVEIRSDIRGNMVSFAWLVGIIVAIYLVGFLISMPLFVFSYLKWRGHGWIKSAIIAVVTVILTYLIFVRALQFDLFPGLILEGMFEE